MPKTKLKQNKKAKAVKKTVVKAKKADRRPRTALSTQKAVKPHMGPKMTKKEELEAKSVRLINKGRARGFVTYDEILKEFPTIEEDIMFLDELYERFSKIGIDVLEGGGLLDTEPPEPVA